MKLATIAMATLLTAIALPPQSAIGPPPPRARVARDLLVSWQGAGQVQRVSRPGHYQFDFACSNARGSTEQLTLDVTPQAQAEIVQQGYRECTPEDVRRLTQEGSEENVQLSDAVGSVQFLPQPQPLPLPGGQTVQLGAGLTTAGGALCLVPAARPDLGQFLRTTVPGDRLAIKGRLLPGPLGIAPGGALLVDGLEFPGRQRGPQDSAWAVKVIWDGREVASFSDLGDHPVLLPCTQHRGGTEQAVLRLREGRVVDLSVEGHPVMAELADTPQSRSWGLQGRSGLAPDEGMLFYFERPLRAIFVMKTVSFPIAIAFISTEGILVNIEKLNPGDQQGVTSAGNVCYVLEMQQDWFDKNGVRAGGRVVIP